MAINLNELLQHDKKITDILTESELLLVFELSKYAKLLLGKEISLNGISISDRLKKTPQFDFVISNNLNLGRNQDLAEGSNNSKVKNNHYLNPNLDLLEIDLQITQNNEIHINFEHHLNKYLSLGRNVRSMVYISLVARIMIENTQRKNPCKLIIDHSNYSHQEDEYNDLYILQNYGNKLLSDLLFKIHYKDSDLPQPEWVAYVTHHRRQGLMNKEYNNQEKYNYLVNNLNVGDVVLYYHAKRNKRLKRKDKITKINSCYPAVVKEYTKDSISIECCYNVSTRETFAFMINQSNDKISNYESALINNRMSRKSFELTEIGIGDTTFGETDFLLLPLEHDGTYQFLKKDGQVERVWLNSLETIYAVFEDRNIRYNRSKFLETYFKGKTPIYDLYR